MTSVGTPDTGAQPLDADPELATPEGAVGDSLSVAVWTFISRFTGVLRGITIAAVLGATYFANTYQFTNSLPNLIFYGLLAGSLFSSLLVPALVPHIDSGDGRAAARTAGGLLGMALLGMLAIVPVMAVLTPWLLRLGAIGSTGTAAHSQAHTGALLILMLLPQVPLYAIVGTATAVMNAHRKFALAAAAPALENLGTIAVLGVVAVLFTGVATNREVPLPLLLLLGIGTTCAVLLHASVQWWGARRVGVVLRPNAGWRDPLVRATIGRALPAVVQAALAALQLAALLLVADRVAGGVVAFQLAANFYFLPIAIGATPVALSLVPRLSRMAGPGQAGLFRDTYVRGLTFAAFLVVPAATAYAVLSAPLAGAIGFGAFGAADGRELLAASLLGLAPAITGETLFLVTTYACYARKDTTGPLRGMIIHAAVCAAGIAAVAHLHGTSLLTGLGLAFSGGSVAGSVYVVRHLRRGLPHGGEPALRPLARTFACSAIMAGPAWVVAELLSHHLKSPAGRVATMLVVSLFGAGIYFTAQGAMRAPQIQWASGAVLGRWRRQAAPPGPQAARHRAPRAAAAAESGRGLPLSRWRPGGFGIGDRIQAMSPALGRRRVDALLLLAPLLVGALVAVKLKYALVLVIAFGLIGWVLARPAIGAYLLIFLTPLIVGLNAAAVIPALRPNQTLMVLIGLALVIRWLARLCTEGLRWPQIDRVDISLIAFGVTSSVLPLMMMVVRQRAITVDDLLYSIVVWKLIAEYVIVRTVITTNDQAMRCVQLSLASAAVVAVFGILQALGGHVGVGALLTKFYSPVGIDPLSDGRGGSLLGLPAAVADLATLNLAIAVAMLVRGHRRKALLTGLSIIFALAVVAAAEFSTFIALVLAVGALVAVTRSGRILGYAIPVSILGGALLWPVIQTRLSGFHSASGLPISWIDRLYNLHTYFWPVLFSDHNWILGVRPAARVPVASKRYLYVWIESGYTWLLWGGGIPLLASYLAFVATSLRKTWVYARRADAAGIVATGVFVLLCAQLFLMLLDPHVTYRGSGDELFLLLALIRRLPGRRQQADATRTGTAAVPAALYQAAPA